jgi:hypothetical protein
MRAKLKLNYRYLAVVHWARAIYGSEKHVQMLNYF